MSKHKTLSLILNYSVFCHHASIINIFGNISKLVNDLFSFDTHIPPEAQCVYDGVKDSGAH